MISTEGEANKSEGCAMVLIGSMLSVKTWVFVGVLQRVFSPPCHSEGAENISVMLRLKTEGGKAAEEAGKREEEGIGIEV